MDGDDDVDDSMAVGTTILWISEASKRLSAIDQVPIGIDTFDDATIEADNDDDDEPDDDDIGDIC